MAKHAPARFDTYLKTHANYMRQLEAEGFVITDTVVFNRNEKSSFMKIKGDIFLVGNLKMHVNKLVKMERRINSGIWLHTVEYAYNLSLLKVGNVFRYDNMHAHYGHLVKDHKHVYDPPGQRLKLLEIRDKEDVPTLGEALDEARQFVDLYRQYETNEELVIDEVPTAKADY